ncbi:hypothetical protein BJ741DRAFT_707668 [Chytriomyces cf. hyalinus JEL632]|nr:hypothetical protein BJ741DRAFT_707668 [Chytriomyces cf. hyalinus JEL632]
MKHLVLRLTLILASLAPLTSADQCFNYTGGYCSSLVTYPLLLSTGNSIAKTEATLKANGLDLLISINKTSPAYGPCVSSFLQWACYSSYPSCVNDALDQITCKSLCETARTECTSMFSMFGKTSSLPDCAVPIPSLNVPYSSTARCLGRHSELHSPVKNTTIEAPKHVTCPSFLLKNPAFNDSDPEKILPHIAGQTCTGPCCIPCPLIHQFYDPFSVQATDATIFAMCVISAVLSAFLLVSFAMFPKRQVYPNSFIMLFTLSSFCLHVTLIPGLGIGNGSRVTCLDPITEATQETSVACGVQGFLATFFALSLTTWISLFMFNLYLAIVHKKEWLMARYSLAINMAVVIWSLLPGVSLASKKGISSIGFACMFSAKLAITHFFIPMGLVGWPGIILTIVTVFHLIHLLTTTSDLQARRTSGHGVGKSDTGTNGPSHGLQRSGSARSHTSYPVVKAHLPTSGSCTALDAAAIAAAAAGVGGAGGGGRTSTTAPYDPPEHSLALGAAVFKKSNMALERETDRATNAIREHREKIATIVQKSWRSVAICVCFTLVFGTFWIFYLQFSIVMEQVDASTEWVANWYGCVLDGGSQSQCARVARPYVPSVYGIAASQFLISSVGTCMFTVFGSGMIEEWRKLVKGTE